MTSTKISEMWPTRTHIKTVIPVFKKCHRILYQKKETILLVWDVDWIIKD